MFVRKSTYDLAIAERDVAREQADDLYLRLQKARAERDAAKEHLDRTTRMQSGVIRSRLQEIDRLRVECAGLRAELAKFNTRGPGGRFVKRAASDPVQAA